LADVFVAYLKVRGYDVDMVWKLLMKLEFKDNKTFISLSVFYNASGVIKVMQITALKIFVKDFIKENFVSKITVFKLLK